MRANTGFAPTCYSFSMQSQDASELRSGWYNYPVFSVGAHERCARFEESPPLGAPGPDFTLWRLEDRGETSLHEVLAEHLYTIVEFGSFT